MIQFFLRLLLIYCSHFELRHQKREVIVVVVRTGEAKREHLENSSVMSLRSKSSSVTPHWLTKLTIYNVYIYMYIF